MADDDIICVQSGRVGAFGPLMVVQWLALDDGELLEVAEGVAHGLVRRFPRKLAALHWFPHDARTGLPSPSLRARLDLFLDRLNPSFGFGGVCIEQGGMRGALLRSVVTSATILRGDEPKVRVFSDLDATTHYLRASDDDLGQLTRALIERRFEDSGPPRRAP